MNIRLIRTVAIGALASGILLHSSVAQAFSIPGILTSILTGGPLNPINLITRGSTLLNGSGTSGQLTNAQVSIQQGEAATGVSLQTILAASGLNSEKYGDCVSPQVLGELGNTLSNFRNILNDAVNSFLQDFLRTEAQKLVQCIAFDFSSSPGGSNPMPDCTIPIASDTKEALVRLKDREIQQNFIARCVARVGLAESVKTITNVMLEQGPYGEGPAWVTSWEDIPRTEQKRAEDRMYTILVNTDICPYMRNQVLHDLRVPKSYIDNPPPLSGSLSVDSGDPFTLRGQCTLPAGFTPQDFQANPSKYGGYIAVVNVLREPQNNPRDFENMALAELANQIQTLTQGRTNDALAGGGVQSIADCLQYGPDGVCTVHGPDKQTGGTLRDENAAIFQGEIDWLTGTDGTQKKAIDDIRTSIANRIISLGNQPLPFHIELGPEDNVQNGFTPTPTPISKVGSGDPNDPACTGGNPQCTCVRNDQNVQASFTPLVADAIARAMQVNSELFVNGTAQVVPGDERLVLQAICDRMQPANEQTCIPHPGENDEIVIIGGAMTFSVHVINSDGFVTTNGGHVIAACEPGVQN